MLYRLFDVVRYRYDVGLRRCEESFAQISPPFLQSLCITGLLERSDVMIRPIMTNEFFSQSSDLASIADDAVCDDLLDTLEFHRDRCVGLAANMIGVRKRIIVFDDSGKHRVMLNPVIV